MELLIQNVDADDLEKVALNLQKLCEIIEEKERTSDEYVLSSGWLKDAPISKEFLERFNERIIEQRE